MLDEGYKFTNSNLYLIDETGYQQKMIRQLMEVSIMITGNQIFHYLVLRVKRLK